MLTLDRVPARTRSTSKLPVTPAERTNFFSDALFAAVAALTEQLSHSDPEVVREAAVAILDLEKTRMRHGREVTGTESVPLAPRVVQNSPPAERVGHDESPAGRSRRQHREFIAELRAALQSKEDEFGTGKGVTAEDAEAFYRQAEERVRNGFDPRASDGGGPSAPLAERVEHLAPLTRL